MKVKHLLAFLIQYDPETEVVIPNGETGDKSGITIIWTDKISIEEAEATELVTVTTEGRFSFTKTPLLVILPAEEEMDDIQHT